MSAWSAIPRAAIRRKSSCRGVIDAYLTETTDRKSFVRWGGAEDVDIADLARQFLASGSTKPRSAAACIVSDRTSC